MACGAGNGDDSGTLDRSEVRGRVLTRNRLDDDAMHSNLI